MKIGKDCVGIFVTCICHDGNGKILMGRRGKQARDMHGHWEFGGGTLEHGESAEECLRREFKEEWNVELDDVTRIDIREFVSEDNHWLGLFYVAKVVNMDEVRIVEPVNDALEWFGSNNLPEKLMEGDEEMMEEYRKFI